MLKLQSSLLLAGVLAFSAAHAQDNNANANKMSRDAYKAEKDAIEATYKADKEACKTSTGNAKDICEAQAKAKEDVAKAELDYKRSGTERDRMNVAETKAKANYDVAKEKCEDQAHDKQSACKKEAKAQEESAIAAAKKQH